jgi:hypothetical protein
MSSMKVGRSQSNNGVCVNNLVPICVSYLHRDSSGAPDRLFIQVLFLSEESNFIRQSTVYCSIQVNGGKAKNTSLQRWGRRCGAVNGS